VARAETVRVRGLRELRSSLSKVNKEADGKVKDALKDAAGPVVSATQAKLSRFRGVSMQVRPHVLMKGVVVRQDARKKTGKRPDFGGLQMRKAFIPALEENERQIINEVEKALDRLLDEF